MKPKSKIKLAYTLIVLSAILLVFHFINLDYENSDWKNYFGPLGNALLIIAMVLSIRDLNKEKNE